MNLPHAAGACRTAVVQRVIRNLYLAAVLAMQVAVVPAEAGEEPLSNLAVMQELARGIGLELAARIPGTDTVAVSAAFAPDALAWVVQGPIRQALAARPARLVVSGAEFGVECTVTTLDVRYENSRRGWFLGGREVDRVVNIALDGTLTDRRSGAVLATRTYARTSRDTVEVSAVPSLEEAALPFTRAPLPGEGFFSWAAEPLIMIAAIAVSVYLLFHVRS